MRLQLQRGRGVIAVAMTLATLLVVGAQPAFADDAGASKVRYRLTGHGTDHGVGFSQRGAGGRARAGQTYDQILLHYFDSKTTFLDDVPEDTILRVLLVRSRTPSADRTALVQ